ncbi:MAG: RDD family protein [Archangium sp.]|nr:RDD family protein [Archangium sp.]
MTDALQVATPERVSVELPIAGLGSRAMAYLVDVLLLGAVALVVYFAISFFVPEALNTVLGLGRSTLAIGVALLGGGLWIYWTVFEVAWNGQSPGKRLVRIRVVKSDGSPTTFFSSAVRNLLRLVDFLPTCYPVGVITMLIDKKHRRLGDLLAGTILVRDEKVSLDAYARLEAATASAVEVNVLEIAVKFLQRYDSLEPDARLRIGKKLATRLGLTTLSETASAEDVRNAIRAKLESPNHG